MKDNDMVKLKESLDGLIKKEKLISDDLWKLNDDLFNTDKHNREFETSTNTSLGGLIKKSRGNGG